MISSKVYIPIIVAVACFVVFFALGMITENYFRRRR